jgi:hypothetical protein
MMDWTKIDISVRVGGGGGGLSVGEARTGVVGWGGKKCWVGARTLEQASGGVVVVVVEDHQ